jgi:hypothetical protein
MGISCSVAESLVEQQSSLEIVEVTRVYVLAPSLFLLA